MTPEQRSLRARLASHESWANTSDPAARTEPARKAFDDRFVNEARERYGDLPADELARRAQHLRSAFYVRLAMKSAQARASRAALLAPTEPTASQDGGRFSD